MATKGLKNTADEVYTEGEGTVLPIAKPTLTVLPGSLTVRPLDGKLHVTVSTGFTANTGNFESRVTKADVSGEFSADTDLEAISEYLFDAVYAVLNDELSGIKVQAERNPSSIIHTVVTD